MVRASEGSLRAPYVLDSASVYWVTPSRQRKALRVPTERTLNRLRPTSAPICKQNSKKNFIKEYDTCDHAAPIKIQHIIDEF